MTDTNETPCLVETARGVSVLYNNRYLFSRFDPQKAFLSVLNNTTILDESLILCLSPVLDFPITAIFEKIKRENSQGCFVIAVEKNKALYDFFHANTHTIMQQENFSSILIHQEVDIALLLEGFQTQSKEIGATVPNVSHFRRVIVFEASSEVNQNKSYYSSVVHYAQNSISQFWKNRMTLVKLGKLFSKNTLVNVKNLSHSIAAKNNCIEKPILVVGAGTSLDKLLPFIKDYNDSFYIVSIAAAIQSLTAHGIKIDAIVSLEGQYATDKAFIALGRKDTLFFADIASRPKAFTLFSNVSPFLSEYTKSPLLERIKEAFPTIPVFPPLGSVGLSATELALFLRKSVEVPVFFTGLDFSFPIGKTHAKESPHIKEALQNCTRLSPVGNVAMSFRHGTFRVHNSHQELMSDSGLKVYADLFNERYKNVQNLFNLSEYGMIDDGFYCTTEDASKMLAAFNNTHKVNTDFTLVDNSNDVETFYKAEKEKLEAIKGMLTGKTELDEAILLELLEACSYLYDHFPDGHLGPVLRQDFLNRVRGEVDVFLKQIIINNA